MKDQPEEYWKQKLTPEQYHVVREKGTEPPFSGEYVNLHDDGTYHCVACNQELFTSVSKFDSHSGWPSFTEPINLERVELSEDRSFGMIRTEVRCSNCGGHLGHVFDDGPRETGGLRYCLSSVSLKFEKHD